MRLKLCVSPMELIPHVRGLALGRIDHSCCDKGIPFTEKQSGHGDPYLKGLGCRKLYRTTAYFVSMGPFPVDVPLTKPLNIAERVIFSGTNVVGAAWPGQNILKFEC